MIDILRGYTKDGATLLQVQGDVYTVQCSCGAKFNCGRKRMLPSCVSKLHCPKCKKANISQKAKQSYWHGIGPVEPTTPKHKEMCNDCNGWGTIGTGIAEASHTMCNACDGRGFR